MDGYMEYMVSKKKTGKDKAVKAVTIAFIVILALGAVLCMANTLVSTVLFVLAIGLALLAANVIFPKTSVEYEYLYCDKHISVDAIYAKNSRKNLGDYDLEKVQLICPVNSYRAGEYKNVNLKVYEYWSLEKSDNYEPYAIFYDGNQKIVLDLPRDFVKMIQNNAPRKVFFD